MDTTKALYHTMMKSWPETIAPTTLSPSDAEQLQHRVMSQPLEMAPSPPGPSTPRPNPAEPTTPESMQVPSLIVGCSTPADQQQPVVMRQGDLKASGTVTAQSIRVMSDMRLKHNILPLGIDAVDILRQLNIVQYHLNNDPQGPPHIGVLAQDVAQVLADAVEIDTASGLKSVKLDLLLFIVMRTQQQFLQFLPLLTELDKQHRLGLPLLMHRQQQAAQQTPNPDQQMLSATTPSCTDSTDSDSASEVNMLDAGGMECSSNSSGCQQGDQQPSSDPSAPLSFKSDKTMISHILADLGEDNKGMPVVVGKLLGKLGREAVWKTYRQAKCTTLHGADGGKRSPGSTFLHLLKKQEQEANIT